MLLLKPEARDALRLYHSRIHSKIDNLSGRIAKKMNSLFFCQAGEFLSEQKYFSISEKKFLKDLSRGQEKFYFYDIMPYTVFSIYNEIGQSADSLQQEIERAARELDFFDLQILSLEATTAKILKISQYSIECLKIAQILMFMLSLEKKYFPTDIDGIYNSRLIQELQYRYQISPYTHLSASDVSIFDYPKIDVDIAKDLLVDYDFEPDEIMATLLTYSPAYYLSQNVQYGQIILQRAVQIVPEKTVLRKIENL